MPKYPSLANPKCSNAPCPSTKMAECAWAAWVTGTCSSFGHGFLYIFTPPVADVGALPLCGGTCYRRHLCHLLQSTDAQAGEKTPHESTYAHTAGVGASLLHPMLTAHELHAGSPWHLGGNSGKGTGRGCGASRAISSSNGQGLTAAVFTPVYVLFVINVHAPFIPLFRLIPPLFQKCLCNSPVAV